MSKIMLSYFDFHGERWNLHDWQCVLAKFHLRISDFYLSVR